MAFLLLNGERSHLRERLAGLLWADRTDARARSCLRTELWRIHRLLSEAHPTGDPDRLFDVSVSRIGLKRGADVWVDVRSFLESARSGLSPSAGSDGNDQKPSLEAAAAVYAGDFLEGTDEPWSVSVQARLRRLYLDVCQRLAEIALERHDYSTAVTRSEHVLRQEPLRESVHRTLMMALYGQGDRTRALLQFRKLERVLTEELAVRPMRESVRLFDAIRREAARASAPLGDAHPAPPPPI